MSTNDIIAAAQRQAELEADKAAFFASGGRVKVIRTVDFAPAPPRRNWIDPDTVLVRRRPTLSRAERNALKRMAEAI